MTYWKDAYKLGTDCKFLNHGHFFEYIILVISSLLIKSGDFVFDGGAAQARFTTFFSELVGVDGSVLAIEANPDFASSLHEKLGRSKHNTTVINSALGDTNKDSVRFHIVSSNPGKSGIIERSDLSIKEKESVRLVDVPMITIDKAVDDLRLHLNTLPKLRLIKLDIEGGEYNCLKGAARCMSSDKPMILFEDGGLRSAKDNGYSPEDWFALFKEHGYFIYDIIGRPFSIDMMIENVKRPWNYIAVARDNDVDFVEKDLPRLVSALASVAPRIAMRNF